MSDHSPTLNSRLRVLVAKTFRAEQLYGTIRNNADAKQAALTGMIELANDIRAREWQRSHNDLRTELNDILTLGKSSLIVDRVLLLQQGFLKRSVEDEELIEKGVREISEGAARHEFTGVWRVTAELIRLKARHQANKAIAEELMGVLEASGYRGRSVRPEALAERRADAESPQQPAAAKNAVAKNVIPMQRRHAS